MEKYFQTSSFCIVKIHLRLSTKIRCTLLFVTDSICNVYSSRIFKFSKKEFMRGQSEQIVVKKLNRYLKTANVTLHFDSNKKKYVTFDLALKIIVCNQFLYWNKYEAHP